MHLVSFIIRIYHDARSAERQSRQRHLTQQFHIFLPQSTHSGYQIIIIPSINSSMEVSGLESAKYRRQKFPPSENAGRAAGVMKTVSYRTRPSLQVRYTFRLSVIDVS